MPLRFPCPRCNAGVVAPDGSEGRALPCPRCKEFLVVPVPSPQVQFEEPPQEAEVASWSVAPPVREAELPSSLTTHEDEDTSHEDLENSTNDDEAETEERKPRSRNRIDDRGGWRCPYCRSDMGKRSTLKIATVGWILMFLTLGCFPLCFLFLLIKDHDADFCLDCGSRLGG